MSRKKTKAKVQIGYFVSADIPNKKIIASKYIRERLHILSSREAMLFNMYLNMYPSFEVEFV